MDPSTGLIDYDKLEESAVLFKPNMIIRALDCQRFRAICDKVSRVKCRRRGSRVQF